MPIAKYNAGCGMMGSEVGGMLDEQYEQQFKNGRCMGRFVGMRKGGQSWIKKNDIWWHVRRYLNKSTNPN